jgi:hypothetical protein
MGLVLLCSPNPPLSLSLSLCLASLFSLLSLLSLTKRCRHRWVPPSLSLSSDPRYPHLQSLLQTGLVLLCSPHPPLSLSLSRVVLFFRCALVDFLLLIPLLLPASFILHADLMKATLFLRFHCCFHSLCRVPPLYFLI